MAGLWRWRGAAGCAGPLASGVADAVAARLLTRPWFGAASAGPGVGALLFAATAQHSGRRPGE
jgi:hypothetical protein